MSRKIYIQLLVLAFALCGISCTSYKHVAYLQNSAELTPIADSLHSIRFKPKDQLSIVLICTEDPVAVNQFKLHSYPVLSAENNYRMQGNRTIQAYTVDNDGNIDFPMLGTLHVAGMTHEQLADYVADRIEGTYLRTRPEVVVRLRNFHVSVLGDVKSAGTFEFYQEKVSIFEALAKASDLDIHGIRSKVKIIREASDGTKHVATVDLTDANLINTPYYYMQQNDVVYVTPNVAHAKNAGIGTDTRYWFRALSITLAMANLTYRILR